MPKFFFFLKYFFAIICLCGFCHNTFGYTAGEVTFLNNNKATLNINDALQFQLITNGNGVVETAVLAAASPDNIQTLTRWSFSDQTNQFIVYVRNASKGQISYQPCTGTINYNSAQPPIFITGTGDGLAFKCQVS